MVNRVVLLLLSAAALVTGCAPNARGCSTATVIATGSDIDVPAQRTPTPYVMGGEPTLPPPPQGSKLDENFAREERAGGVPSDTELSDGHVYRLVGNDSVYRFTPQRPVVNAGESVQICEVKSRLSGRIYYRMNKNQVYRKL